MGSDRVMQSCVWCFITIRCMGAGVLWGQICFVIWGRITYGVFGWGVRAALGHYLISYIIYIIIVLVSRFHL